jgi:hypothetical protein
LTLTLVSALSAVLGKGWADTYLPASAGKDSHDACERHLRAIRVYQWHLDGVLAAILLLLQLSLLLFLAGLVIFAFGDSESIGKALLALIALTIVLYIVVTFLPRLSPACPFRTTLSTFVPGTDDPARYKENDRSATLYKEDDCSSTLSKMISNFRSRPKREIVEVMILAWILANSTREDAKDEAFKAIAGLDPIWSADLRCAMREYKAIPSLCMQLKRASGLLPGRDDKALEGRTTMKEASKKSELVKAIERVVPHIIDALKDTDFWVRISAAEALGEISKQPELVKVVECVVPHFVHALKDTESWVRAFAVEALGEISKQPELVKVIEGVVPHIVDALKDTGSLVRACAVEALGEISKQPELVKAIESVVPDIVDILKNTDFWVRVSAVEALGKISKQRK